MTDYAKHARRYAAVGQLKKLEFEEQAHARKLVRLGLLRFERRSYADVYPGSFGCDITFVVLCEEKP